MIQSYALRELEIILDNDLNHKVLLDIYAIDFSQTTE